MARPDEEFIHSRSKFFWAVTVVIVSLVMILDYQDCVDACLATYGINATMSLVCGVLFVSWWYVKGDASSIFKWITFLLIAIAYSEILQGMARVLFLRNDCDYAVFLNSFWWEYRSIPKMVVLIYLLSFAIWQRIYGKIDSSYK